MNKVWIRPGILAAVLLTAWPSARGETDALGRFNGEYSLAARRLEEQFGSVKGTCRLRAIPPDGSKAETRSEAEFAIDHGYEKVIIRRKSPGPAADAASGEFIYCVGPGTTFYLSRIPGASSYTVEGIGSTASDRSAYVTLFGRFVNAHYGVFGQPLTRLMKTPGFRTLDAEYVTEGKARLVKVNFEVGEQDPKSTISVIFDPQDGWNIRSSDFRTGKTPGIRITTDVSYGPSREGGFSLPHRVVSHDTSGGTSICEFAAWEFEPTPEAEFKMGSYNLPDLVSAPKSSRHAYTYWLAGVAAVGFTAALVLRRYSTGQAS